MINNVADLKNRTLVESNTLKSFILTKNQSWIPNRDNILIHDYQIANSVTINSILSNYIVDLKYAWKIYDESLGNENEQYFKIVQEFDESQGLLLDDSTKLILDVSDGDGSFNARKLRYTVNDVAVPDGTVKFVNLDTIWYGIVFKQQGGVSWDEIHIVDDMNNFYVNPNPFGENVNPFDKKPDAGGKSFNEQLKDSHDCINCIVENRFRNNIFDDSVVSEAVASNMFAKVIPSCIYLVCTENRLCGLVPIKNGDGDFSHFVKRDIGSLIPNIDQTTYNDNGYQFKFCNFSVIGEQATLFVVFSEVASGKFHYVYFNEDSYDGVYGFNEMKSVVVDQLVADCDSVFSKFESIRSLENVTIAMTDYGFWDIEPNKTNYMTYSYRGSKEYAHVSVSNFNDRTGKLVKPTTSVDDTDKIDEYDKIWELSKKQSGSWVKDVANGTHYKCRYVNNILPNTNLESPNNPDYPVYVKNIVGTGGKTQSFVGGNVNFAVYDSVKNGTEWEPVQILARMNLNQFSSLAFSMSNLVSPFIKWLYDKVVYHTPAEYGEYYLYNNHDLMAASLNEHVTGVPFTQLKYQVIDGDGLIGNDGKFSSIRKLVESVSSSAQSTLYRYCDVLNGLVNSAKTMNWLLLGGIDALKEKIGSDFSGNIYGMKKEAFVKDVVDKLIVEYPLLGYFRKYLEQHLLHDFENCPSDWVVDTDSYASEYAKVIQSVQDFIRQRVITAMCLGEYRDSGENTNERFPRIDSYIYQNNRVVKKYEIQDIMSQSNTKKEVVQDVSSMPFFKKFNSYDEMSSALEDTLSASTMFKMEAGADFIAKSNYTVAGDNSKLDISWYRLRNWLFPKSKQTDDTLLHKFVKTQFYRPMFFNDTDYVTFSQNPNVYRCDTDKYFRDHRGVRHQLILDNWPDNPVVNKSGSGLNRSPSDNFDIDNIQYHKLTNLLEYDINYDQIELVDGKFVNDDIEYYAVLVNVDGTQRVNHIYFNEFQKDLQSAADQVEISGNQFELNGKIYQIEDGRITVDSATTEFKDDEKEFKCEILTDDNGNEMFRMDGVWYNLVKSDSTYASLKYAKVDDNRLQCIDIDENGTGRYEAWGMTFKFITTGSDAWRKVYVVKHHQYIVEDILKREWCVFDDHAVSIDEEKKTYDWYLSNEIIRMRRDYSQQMAVLDRLGGGILYNGLLETDCKIRIQNEVKGGDVVSNAVMVKTVDGKEVTKTLGVLFNRHLLLSPGTFVQGTADNQGIITDIDYDNGQTVFILKKPRGGLNKCNSVWMPLSTWQAGHVIVTSNVGHSEFDTENNKYVVAFDEQVYDTPERLTLTPVYQTDESTGAVLNTVGSFLVDTRDDGSEQYNVKPIGNNVHVIAKGARTGVADRYVVNISTGNVKRLVFNDMPARTIDFETQYWPGQLRDNLFNNIRQYMLNEISERILASTNSDRVPLEINPDVENYLDLFQDQISSSNYVHSNEIDADSQSNLKFQQIFKNNLHEMDDSVIQNGKLYKTLMGKIVEVFGNNPNIVLVDSPSMQVRRVTSSGATDYIFKFEIDFDLYLMQNKSLMNWLRVHQQSDFKTGWIIANAVVRKMKGEVVFTPVFDPDSADRKMGYKVMYFVKAGTYDVEYDQIIYNYNGKTKHKSIEKNTSKTITVSSDLSYPSTMSVKEVSNIVNELFSGKLYDETQNYLFTDETIRNLILSINNLIGTGSSTNVIIDIQSLLNPVKVNESWVGNGIWELGHPIPPKTSLPDQGIILSTCLGYTEIDGELYQVQNEVSDGSGFVEADLIQVDGRNDYKIYPRATHIYNTNYTVSPPTTTITVGTRNVICDMQNPIVKNSYFTDYFNYEPAIGSGDSLQRYLTYKNDVFPIQATAFSFDVANVQNYDLYQEAHKTMPESGTLSFWLFDDENPRAGDTIPPNPPMLVGNGLNEDLAFTVELTEEQTQTLINTGSITLNDRILSGLVINDEEENEDDGSDESTGEDTPPSQTKTEAEELNLAKTTVVRSAGNMPRDIDPAQNNGWIGVNGKFNVTISNVKPDESTVPKVTVQAGATPCYTIHTIPSATENTIVGEIDEYVPVAGLKQEIGMATCQEVEKTKTVDSTDPDTGEATTTTVPYTVYSLRFRIYVTVKKRRLALKPTGSTKYLKKDILSHSGGITRVIEVTDLNDNSIGTLNVGYIDCPINLLEINDIDPSTGEYVNKTSNDYDYRPIYVELNMSGSSWSIKTDGIYAPAFATVISPLKSMGKDGDIYGRYYEVENRVFSDHRQIDIGNTDVISNGRYWMDNVSVVKSISCAETNSEWRTLTQSPVPESMVAGINNYMANTLKLDDEYFVLALTQLMTFLRLVRDELLNTVPVDEIRSMCSFRYDIALDFPQHATSKDKWNVEGATIPQSGLFGCGHGDDTYVECRNNLNDQLFNQFVNDYSTLNALPSGIAISNRDYRHILQSEITWLGTNYPTATAENILDFRNDVLEKLHELLNVIPPSGGNLIDEIFGSLADTVRYINAVNTNVVGTIVGMFITDGKCNLFAKPSNSSVRWYQFDSGKMHTDLLIETKRDLQGEYTFEPKMIQGEYQIKPDGWVFRMLNRDFSIENQYEIHDAFALQCHDISLPEDKRIDLWYVSPLDLYVQSGSTTGIVDMAYEQNTDSLYVLFDGDNLLYRYNHLEDRKNSQNIAILQKDVADMRIETFHSVYITEKQSENLHVYVDYLEPNDWSVLLYGEVDSVCDQETWGGSPGSLVKHFLKYNTILVGDTLFDSEQLKFQNISKNKDMFDILDINEVDGCYYGLFKDELKSTEEQTLYTVFKTAASYIDANGVERTGVVQRLPYRIVDPNLYRTNDPLYSLYVVEQASDGKIQLREISVPDSELYANRTIPLQGIMESIPSVDGGSSTIENFNVMQMVMSNFRLNDSKSSFFVLSDVEPGFHKIHYTNDFEQVSIDTLDGTDLEGNPIGLKDRLRRTLWDAVIGKHILDKHMGEDYFSVISSKVNQFGDFSTFSIIPVEFRDTQDIGVIPNQKVDDTDLFTDHRVDSVQVSTDILWTEGMVADSDTNPGLVTAAVSNPATTYDDDSVFTKSQRNPSIVDSEFYDYIYDQDGNALMDLYQVPFIYQVNSNNTYDLYINIPTTRTKYLNRVTGTLKDDGTSQVLKDDSRTRRNFLDETMANNLDESTTKLRVYIDRKYVSIGNVELVEISGNSIPLQIYRDVPNDGLYDSVALESRWNGEVVELNEPSKDINKVMLEFECYGTDSQSIHIQGKTMIHHSLDDKRYNFGK